MVVLVVRYLAKPDTADQVAELIREMMIASRAEPGCRRYDVLRSVEDPRRFVLYEIYDDEAAFKAHSESEHFQRLVLGQIVPLLEDRLREFFTPLEP